MGCKQSKDTLLNEFLSQIPIERRANVVDWLNQHRIIEFCQINAKHIEDFKKHQLLCDYRLLKQLHGELEDQNVIKVKYELKQNPHNQITEGIPTYYILVVGLSGHGKSTFINSFTNYLCGVESMTNNVRFQAIGTQQNTGTSQNRSTKEIIVQYSTTTAVNNINQSFNIVFIDTPGLNDTQGIAQDQQNIQNIINFLNNLNQLHFILFVICESKMEMLKPDEVAMTKILELFGINSIKNSIEVLTFSNLIRPNISILEQSIFKQVYDLQNQDDQDAPKYLQFQNSAIWAKGNVNAIQKYQFEESIRNYGKLIDLILGIDSAVSILPEIKNVMSIRNELKHQTQNLSQQISNCLDLIGKITEQQTNLEQIINKKQDSAQYNKIKMEMQLQRENLPSDVYVTNCTICNFTCHENCSFNDQDDGKQYCVIMVDGFCTKCQNRCHWRDHVNQTFINKFVEVPIQYIDEDLRAQHNRLEQLEQDIQKEVTFLKNQFNFHYIGSQNTLAQIYTDKQQLNRIALLKCDPSCIGILQQISQQQSQDENQQKIIQSLIDVQSEREEEFNRLIQRRQEQTLQMNIQ